MHYCLWDSRVGISICAFSVFATTKVHFTSASYCHDGCMFYFYTSFISQNVSCFLIIRSDPNQRKPKLTILIKQVDHESIPFLNSKDFP